MAGAVAGGLAGAYAGYGATGGGVIEDSVSKQMSAQGGPVNISTYTLNTYNLKNVACILTVSAIAGETAGPAVGTLFAIPGYGWALGGVSIVALGIMTAVACI